MTTIITPPSRGLADLELFSARDPLLDDLPVLIFYGPSTTINSTFNSSRIQAHVFSIAGLHHSPRLTVAPNSPLYAAVNHLPPDLQGDEVSRGLAVSLLDYFSSISASYKALLSRRAASLRLNGTTPAIFDDVHAGTLAASMQAVLQKSLIIGKLEEAFAAQCISWLDASIHLPAGSIQRATVAEGSEDVQAFDEDGMPVFHFGNFDPLVQGLGSAAFLPTSKLKRAPSKAPTHSRSRYLSKDAKISLRREMCELVDTENNYIGKLNELVNEVEIRFRGASQRTEMNELLPASLDEILTLSLAFCKDTQSILDATEDEAIKDIESVNNDSTKAVPPGSQSPNSDPTGAALLAKALLAWFPKFHAPYQDYLQASASFGDIISASLNHADSSSARALHDIGEQRMRSILIEPVQRLPRYNLIIDNIIKLLPAAHPSLSIFLKARDVIKDICSLDVHPGSQTSSACIILSQIVSEWIPRLAPVGRLLTAVDVSEVELNRPSDSSDASSVLLLFSDTILIVRKTQEHALTARGLLADFERPNASLQSAASTIARQERQFCISAMLDTSNVHVTEAENGKTIYLVGECRNHESRLEKADKVMKRALTVRLHGQYDGKAAKLTQEICLARLQNRFPDKVRDSGQWALRMVSGGHGLSLVAAVHHDKPDGQQRQPFKAPTIDIRVCDSLRSEDTTKLCRESLVPFTVQITCSKPGRCQLVCFSSGDRLSENECSFSEVSDLLLAQGESWKQPAGPRY